MGITAEDRNGVRWYLYLAPIPVPEHDGFNWRGQKLRAMVMTMALWRWTPPVSSGGLAWTEHDRSHLGGGFRFDEQNTPGGPPPDPPDPTIRILTSSRFPPTHTHMAWMDTPILFGPNRLTAWRFRVDEDGVFSTWRVDREGGQREFVPFWNDHLATDDVVTVNSVGAFGVGPLTDEYRSSAVVLKRGRTVYVPDGRFPAPVGSSMGRLTY